MRTWLKNISLFLLLAALSFFLIEGLSSSWLVFRSLTLPIVRERVHTRYDEQLGWVNIPNIEVADMYGPGRSFKTNSQGFRGDRDFGVEIPQGKVRIICSGDSFTLGFGVDDHDAWCSQLMTLDGRFETVNMGQGGYGVGQAYLWYMRDGVKLRHDVHLFAFVTADFWRMAIERFQGYEKPVLDVENDALVARNTPVPRRSYLSPRLTEIKRRLQEFRSIKLLRKIYSQLRSRAKSAGEEVSEERVQRVAAKLFETLARHHEKNGGVLVLVYLPMRSDYSGTESARWSAWLNEIASAEGVVFVDMIEAFKDLPPDEIDSMFRGHYSEKGNKFVATRLYERLRSMPEIARRFSR